MIPGARHRDEERCAPVDTLIVGRRLDAETLLNDVTLALQGTDRFAATEILLTGGGDGI
jgi:hypothetical protein